LVENVAWDTTAAPLSWLQTLLFVFFLVSIVMGPHALDWTFRRLVQWKRRRAWRLEDLPKIEWGKTYRSGSVDDGGASADDDAADQ